MLPSILQSFNENPHIFPYISEIVPSDKELLEKTVHRIRPHSKNYEDSWGYVIQAARYGRCKWYDPNTGSLIFFGRRASNLDLIVPLFFATPQYLQSALREIVSVLPVTKVTLKNIPPGDIPNFLLYGFRQYHEGEQWNAQYPFADQTYPQQLIDLEKLIAPKGRKYHQLKRLLNKKPQLSFRRYEDCDRDAVLAILAAKDGNTMETPGKEEGMYYNSHAMYLDAEINKFVIVENPINKIIGFTATSYVSPEVIDLVASLFLPDIKIASVWGIYYTLIAMYQEGFTIANVGGCGALGLHTFLKRTFRPFAEIARTHLVFEK